MNYIKTLCNICKLCNLTSLIFALFLLNSCKNSIENRCAECCKYYCIPAFSIQKDTFIVSKPVKIDTIIAINTVFKSDTITKENLKLSYKYSIDTLYLTAECLPDTVTVKKTVHFFTEKKEDSKDNTRLALIALISSIVLSIFAILFFYFKSK